jgi:hypothetical protein
VISHLAAAVDLDDRDVTRRQQVLGLAGLPWVNTGGCWTSHSSSSVCSSRRSVKSLHVARQTGA